MHSWKYQVEVNQICIAVKALLEQKQEQVVFIIYKDHFLDLLLHCWPTFINFQTSDLNSIRLYLPCALLCHYKFHLKSVSD